MVQQFFFRLEEKMGNIPQPRALNMGEPNPMRPGLFITVSLARTEGDSPRNSHSGAQSLKTGPLEQELNPSPFNLCAPRTKLIHSDI